MTAAGAEIGRSSGAGRLAVLSSIVGYAAWYWTLAQGNIGRTGMIRFAQPLIGLPLAVLILGGSLTWPLLLAAAAIVAWAALARRRAETEADDAGKQRSHSHAKRTADLPGDAFAARPFSGNPAAVCPLEAWLPDAVMQAIAAENNLSETAFLVKVGTDYDLRWFTPVCEVDLCGHATLASAYVVTSYLEPLRRRVRFHSRSGPLEVTRDGELFIMDFPTQANEPVEDTAAVAEALGATPRELWSGMDLMAVFASQAEIEALKPDMTAVAALPLRGLIVTAPGEGCDFVSRFFAPAVGVPEDPVTGSAHCALTPYWAERLGKARLQARQLSWRGGALQLERRGGRVLIAGQVSLYMEGLIRLPARVLEAAA